MSYALELSFNFKNVLRVAKRDDIFLQNKFVIERPQQRAVPMVVWWLQNRQTAVPNHVFSSDGMVCLVFSPILTT